MVMASSLTCALLSATAATAISAAFSHANAPRVPRFLTSPRAVSSHGPLTAASSPKAAAPAAVEIPEEYVDDIDAVNIAMDVTQNKEKLKLNEYEEALRRAKYHPLQNSSHTSPIVNEPQAKRKKLK